MSPDTGERWNVNMPAVVGVVFAFLLVVVVWVVVSGGDDDAASPDDSATPTVTLADTGSPTSDSSPPTIAPGTTTPAPMPDLSATTNPQSVPTSEPAPAPVPTVPPPVTTAPGADPDAVPGDLAVPGYPMQAPPCNGSYITILASAVGDQASTAGIANVLEAYPGSNYLRTDQTCPSLTQSIDGEPIYVVFFGPFAVDSDACAARANGTEGAYARQLSDDLGPTHTVACP